MLPVEKVLGTTGPPPPGEGIGRSREGRPLYGHRFGTGEVAVSLIGGCHADEPVGPEMLERLAAWLAGLDPGHPLLTRFRWLLVPHANPDGRERNRAWAEDRVPLTDSRGDPDEGFRLERYSAPA